MNKKRIQSLSEYFYTELTNNTMRFWIEHASDKEYGGFTTFLDRKGEILSPDKPMWVMGRISWVLSRLYNDLEHREEWLDLARHGIEFIRKYGFDKDGRMFYAVRRDGVWSARAATWVACIAVPADHATRTASMSHWSPPHFASNPDVSCICCTSTTSRRSVRVGRTTEDASRSRCTGKHGKR